MFFSCDKLEPFLPVKAPFKCKVSRFQGHRHAAFGQGLAACELEGGGIGHRAAGHQKLPAHGFPPPEGALAAGRGRLTRRVWPALSCIAGDTARRSHPFTLGPAGVPGASQGPPTSQELPLIFRKTGTCRQVTSVTDCAGGMESRPLRGNDLDPGVSASSRGPHKGEAHRDTDKTTLVAVTDEGEGAMSQGHGASGTWKRPETALPGALGQPGPAPPGCSL